MDIINTRTWQGGGGMEQQDKHYTLWLLDKLPLTYYYELLAWTCKPKSGDTWKRLTKGRKFGASERWY